MESISSRLRTVLALPSSCKLANSFSELVLMISGPVE